MFWMQSIISVMFQTGPRAACEPIRPTPWLRSFRISPTPFYPTFIRGVQDVAERNEYDLVIYNTDGSKLKEMNCLQSVRQNKMDGLIAVLFHHTVDHLAELNIPVTHFQVKPELPSAVDVVFIDNAGAVREMVGYLIRCGYDRIGMIAGMKDTPPHRARMQGYRQALEDHHIPIDEALITSGYFHRRAATRACASC